MLPAFDARGNLPPGIHAASWETVVARFGGSPEWRLLLVQLRVALVALAAAGCRRAWLDGSFVGDVERRFGRPPATSTLAGTSPGATCGDSPPWPRRSTRSAAAAKSAGDASAVTMSPSSRHWRSGSWRASSAIGRGGRRGLSSCA